MTDKKITVPEFEINLEELGLGKVTRKAAKDVVKTMKREIHELAVADHMRTTGSSMDEAYVAQNKSYSMTTSHLSEPAKKHHEQLYKGYTEVLTRVSAEVDAADKENVSSARSVYRSAKKDEVYNLNATYLHELFFANCFDPNSELFQDSDTYINLARDWGTFDFWMKDFMASAQAARSGWVVCGYSLFLKKLVNVSVDGHDQGVPAGLIPVLVIDMWEHAYVRDYGADKKGYLTAMMREIDWEVVEDRIKRVAGVKEVMG